MPLKFGTGGIPLTTKKRDTVNGVLRIHELGLEAMELEFVRGVNLSEEKAREVKTVADKHNIWLSVHGPYYVNLAAQNNKTFYGSIKYIADSVYIGGLAGAKSVTFHPAYYQKLTKEETYDSVVVALNKIYEQFEHKKYLDHPVRSGEIFVSPELTGKGTQFGDLEELVALAKEFKDKPLKFCFDFAHKYARSNGKFNTYQEVSEMLSYIEKHLGKEFLQFMHIHMSAIMYSEKGERNHVTMLATVEEYEAAGVSVPGAEKIMKALEAKNKAAGSEFAWQEVLRALKDHDVRGIVVCESPNLELDALLMQNYYRSL